MKTLLPLSLMLVLASAGTALAQDVRYNFDKQANFASFKTYRWVAIKGAQLSDLTDRQVKGAIDDHPGVTRIESRGLDHGTGYDALPAAGTGVQRPVDPFAHRIKKEAAA